MPAGQILQERQLDPETGAIEDQVVCLGDRQLGRDERLTFGPQDVGHRFVARFVGVGLSVEGARVDEQGPYRSPIALR